MGDGRILLSLAVAWALLVPAAPAPRAETPGNHAGPARVEERLRAGDPEGALATGRAWLRATRKDPAVPAAERGRVYHAMLTAATQVGQLRTGNSLAAELLKEERRAYGAGSVDRVPGLYRVADWHRWAGQVTREQDALGEAVRLLESAHGPRDARLAYPLRTLAAAAIGARRDPDQARAHLARARDLAFGSTREDVLERAEIFATQGDLEVVFGDPAAGPPWYRAAWQTLADSTFAGPAEANQRFGVPRPIAVQIPDEPFASLRGGQDHFAAGRVAFGFTVTAEGRVENLRLKSVVAPVESVPEPVLQAFREARYRPRVEAGQALATVDHGYVLRFRSDPTLQPRRGNFGIIERVR